MKRAALDALLDETIIEVVTLSKKDRDRLIDALVEVLVGDPGLEIDDEEEEEDEES